jgi:hypothetical protein
MSTLLPDAERIVSRYLREHAEVAPLVAGERVYTALPANIGSAPLVLVQRIGGVPPFFRPLVLDEAALQIDAWGGTKLDAWTLAETVRQALVSLPGVRYGAVVSGVEFGPLRWEPDGTYKPPRPRYLADVAVYVKPPAEALASAEARTIAEPVSSAGR